MRLVFRAGVTWTEDGQGTAMDWAGGGGRGGGCGGCPSAPGDDADGGGRPDERRGHEATTEKLVSAHAGVLTPGSNSASTQRRRRYELCVNNSALFAGTAVELITHVADHTCGRSHTRTSTGTSGGRGAADPRRRRRLRNVGQGSHGQRGRAQEIRHPGTTGSGPGRTWTNPPKSLRRPAPHGRKTTPTEYEEGRRSPEAESAVGKVLLRPVTFEELSRAVRVEAIDRRTTRSTGQTGAVGDSATYRLDGHVATITYNRPDVLNAINAEMRTGPQ